MKYEIDVLMFYGRYRLGFWFSVFLDELRSWLGEKANERAADKARGSVGSVGSLGSLGSSLGRGSAKTSVIDSHGHAPGETQVGGAAPSESKNHLNQKAAGLFLQSFPPS